MSNDVSALADDLNTVVNGVSRSKDPKDLSLESLTLLLNADRLHQLEKQITNEFLELKQRQEKVSFLHKLIKKINNATVNEEFDCSLDEELKAMLAKAQDHGVDLVHGKSKFSKSERERLVENIRMTVEDHNVLNDMQLQTVTWMVTERYESYQLARSIMKPLHEDKVSKARAMGGR